MTDKLRVVDFPKPPVSSSYMNLQDFLLEAAEYVEDNQTDEETVKLECLVVIGLYEDGEPMIRQCKMSRETGLWLAHMLINHVMYAEE
jgi:hypothetical protein